MNCRSDGSRKEVVTKMLVKICGLTRPEEADFLNKNDADIAGFVLFFPKSKRNITIERACEIINRLDKRIKTAAVVVAPCAREIKAIADAGFDFIQIHGDIDEDMLALADRCALKVLKAFNVSDMDKYEYFHRRPEIAGYVFDADTPGSGETFDWSLVQRVPRDEKLLILAGGLRSDNVAAAIAAIKPDGVDVSSGVEYDGDVFRGKDKNKIASFISAAKGMF